jgi:thiamine-monophosphate kinase
VLSEDQLIERIARAIPSIRGASAGAGLRIGIGHDAALGAPRPGCEWALHADPFLDGVHFHAATYPSDSVGYKSLARATSDLAAVGAAPRFFLLTLSLPPRRTGRWLEGFLRGMAQASRLHGIRLAGGDTSRTDKISISITVVGEIRRGLAMTRSGARPGDAIYVSGRLGRAALGLELMNRLGRGSKPGAELSRLLKPHLYPKIRVELGAWLAENRIPSAMMDLSDGLSTDLNRLCKASRVGARLDAAEVPCVAVPDAASRALRGRKLDPLRLALDGGEDYELLFTVPPQNLRRLQDAPGSSELAVIGQVERGKGITVVGTGGREWQLKPGGWDPFKR